jgi:AraC-like DNA-binding protein
LPLLRKKLVYEIETTHTSHSGRDMMPACGAKRYSLSAYVVQPLRNSWRQYNSIIGNKYPLVSSLTVVACLLGYVISGKLPMVSMSQALIMVRRLKNHPSFEAKDPGQAASELAKSYSDHQVTVAPGVEIHAIHHQACLSTISISYLEYGAQVEISANQIEDFYLIQMPVAGTTRNRSDNEEQLFIPGTALIVDCNIEVSQLWSADCCQIQVKIERKALEQHLNRLLGNPIKDSLRFDLIMDLSDSTIASWWRFIDFLINEFEVGGSALTTGVAVANVESTIINNLLTCQRHNYSEALLDKDSGLVPVHIKKAEQYICDHVAENISIEELVRVCKVSERALYDGFRRFLHTTPMNYQRSYRMKKVHEDLLEADFGQSVTDTVTRWGVTQLGRFSSLYKLVYGQSPSETLKSSRVNLE